MNEIIGSILNLRGLAGARVSRVDVVDDSEVAIHTSAGTYRIRAEKERRQGTDPIEPVALVCKKESIRP